MTTKAQTTVQAPVNTSLKRTSVWNAYLPQIMGGREGKKPASKKQLQAKDMAMPMQTYLESPQISLGKPAALSWFYLC